MIRVIIDKLKDSVWWSMGWGLPPSEHKMQGQSTNDVHTSQYTYKQTKTISDCVTLIARFAHLQIIYHYYYYWQASETLSGVTQLKIGDICMLI